MIWRLAEKGDKLYKRRALQGDVWCCTCIVLLEVYCLESITAIYQSQEASRE